MMVTRTVRRSRAALLSLMLLTSACAAVPHLGPKPIPHAAGDYASSQSLAGSSVEWPGDGWWKRYSDAQLDRLISEGLAGSPDLAAAAARFRTAQGLAQAAGAKLLPTIDANASVTELNPSNNLGLPVWNGFKGVGNAGLSLSFDLDLWGKNRAALRAAKKDTDAARFEAQEARLLLTTGIASAYADLTALYAQRDSLESALDIRTQSLRLVQQRVDVGLDNDFALRLAQARIPQTKADLAATDEAIMLNKHALAALIGEGPDRALTIDRPAAGFAAGAGSSGERRDRPRRPPSGHRRGARPARGRRRTHQGGARLLLPKHQHFGLGRLRLARPRQSRAGRFRLCRGDPRDQPSDLPRRIAPGPISRTARPV